MAAAREYLKLGYLLGCNKTKVSTFVRVVLTANMKMVKILLAGCWALSLVFDYVTVDSTSMFNIFV